MLGYSEATSEQSSIREGAGYYEGFPLGHGHEEGLPQSSKRETFAQSPIDKEENFDGDEVEEREGDEDDEGEGENKGELEVEDDEDEDESDGGAFVEGSLGSPRDGHTRPFILPVIWTINDFKLTMTSKIFNNSRDRYQIPDNIPTCLPGKYKKCYSGKTVDVGMYDTMFVAGLRLPLTALHSQLVIFLGLSISQIALNTWSIFIRAEIIWGHLSGGNRQLALDEFFWCYRPQHILLS